MSLMQAAAIVTLWRSSRFDTHDLAQLLGVHEADVCRVIHAVKDWERGPDLRVVS